MKKFLFGILTFLGIGLSFCSSELAMVNYDSATVSSNSNYTIGNSGCFRASNNSCARGFDIYSSTGTLLFSSQSSFNNLQLFCGLEPGMYLHNNYNSSCTYYLYADLIYGDSSSSSCEDKDITVYYNNGNSSTNITCDGTQAIEINGLSTITSTNTFTPYYNISYKDEDNQSLVESYSKDILYLEDGLFKKTYTGNNDWILTVQGNGNNNIFTGYLPTFEITGGIEDVTESGNIFNNFAENSVKFTLSNIPSYIQYVIILFILFFILGFIRKFRRK